MLEHRKWGNWYVIVVTDTYVIKQLTVNPHSGLSLQTHNYRAEHWVIISGEAVVTLGRESFNLKQGQTIYIPKKEFHRLENASDTPLIVVEIQTGEILDEKDITRYDNDYTPIQE